MMSFSPHIVIASIAVTLIPIVFYLIRKIRQRYEWQEMCHFCHRIQRVPYGHRNAFNCVQCLQYNGFSQDGNYNKVISGQSEPVWPHVDQRYCRPIPDCYSNCGQLCAECNVNQEIKVKLLSEFLPFNENKYNEELEEYKKHLESEYKLCANCQTKLKSILSKPINCFKGFINDMTRRRPQVNQQNVETVFVTQNNGQVVNKLPSVMIFILNTLSLLFGLLLLFFAINEFQDRTEISIIEFPDKVNQFLYHYLSNQTIVIFCGFMSSLTVMTQRKCLISLVFLFLWVLLVLSEFPSLIDNYDKVLFRVLFCSLLVTLITINALCHLIVLVYNKCKQLIIKRHPNITQKPTTNGLKTVSNKVSVKSSDTSADQLIGEQIKTLSIVDGNGLTLNGVHRQHPTVDERPKSVDLSVNSSLNCNQTYNPKNKALVVPAKFHYESIAQTSWVSPFKPNQSPSKSPRKEYLNYSPYLQTTQPFLRSSQWLNNEMSGLVTPPPSVAPSDTSEFGFANRFSSLVNNGMSTHVMNYRSKELNANTESVLRNTIISQQVIRRDSSNDSTDSRVSQMSGSLSSLTIRKTHTKRPTHEYRRQTSLSFNLTQMLILAVFILILFCFVITLSLPLVFRTSFDLNSMNFQLSVESLPQNDVCVK